MKSLVAQFIGQHHPGIGGVSGVVAGLDMVCLVDMETEVSEGRKSRC